ncbi:13123_t:CDS:2 [Entrophospora sp. SA101]|nr:12350_t:CDS:2 [Entrophospora sp. SA101]CAJ0759764.1 13123_t:CDS:2 [Entrophospora sp. SA101]
MSPKKNDPKQKGLITYWPTKKKNEGNNTRPKKKSRHNDATTTNDTTVTTDNNNNDKEKPKQQEEQLGQDEELLSSSYQEIDNNIAAKVDVATTSSSIARSSSSSYSVRPKLSDEENKFLIAFDLNYKFGPCVGITRLQRWDRANKHGLQPPSQVKELLSGTRAPNLNESVFHGRI